MKQNPKLLLLGLLLLGGCISSLPSDAFQAEADATVAMTFAAQPVDQHEANPNPTPPEPKPQPNPGVCDNCDGTGRSGDGLAKCRQCNGTGKTKTGGAIPDLLQTKTTATDETPQTIKLLVAPNDRTWCAKWWLTERPKLPSSVKVELAALPATETQSFFLVTVAGRTVQLSGYTTAETFSELKQ